MARHCAAWWATLRSERIQDDIAFLLRQCGDLQQRMLALVDADAQAFAPLAAGYAIPKGDPARETVLETAALNACQAPMEMVRCCAQSIELLETMLQKGSRMLVSDVGCGALLCGAAMESAALNVYVNTASLSDRDAAVQMEETVDTLLREYLPRAEKIAQCVTDQIRK